MLKEQIEALIQEKEVAAFLCELLESGLIVAKLNSHVQENDRNILALGEMPICMAMDDLWETVEVGSKLIKLGFARKSALPVATNASQGRVQVGQIGHVLPHSYWMNPSTGVVLDLTPAQFVPYLDQSQMGFQSGRIIPASPGTWIDYLKSQMQYLAKTHYIVDPELNENQILYGDEEELTRIGLRYL